MRPLALSASLSALLVAAACGAGSPVEAWLGDWGVGGTQTVVCGDAGTSSPLSGSATVTAGTGVSDIEVAIGGCTLAWDVDGGAASLAVGQSCADALDGGSTTIAYGKGTGALGDNTMTLNASGTTDRGCTVTQGFDLTRNIRPPPMR